MLILIENKILKAEKYISNQIIVKYCEKFETTLLAS